MYHCQVFIARNYPREALTWQLQNINLLSLLVSMHLMSEIVRSKFQKLESMLGKAFTFCPTIQFQLPQLEFCCLYWFLLNLRCYVLFLKPKTIHDLWYNELWTFKKQTCCLYQTCWIQVELKIFLPETYRIREKHSKLRLLWTFFVSVMNNSIIEWNCHTIPSCICLCNNLRVWYIKSIENDFNKL